MKCELCHKADAATAIVRGEGDAAEELYVCEACAKAERLDGVELTVGDCLPVDIDESECRKIAANMNMIRLWGGGQYEKDAFYDLCDELGLMIWHDHMFACGIYPGDDAFLGKVKLEMRHQLKRLRDHASIALWCGDNECVGSLRWYDEVHSDRDFYVNLMWKRMNVQQEMTDLCDPARKFWPSSPCAGPGSLADNWTNDLQGDMHCWGAFEKWPDFDYDGFRPRFCSEFGFQAFPSEEMVEKYFACTNDYALETPAVAHHQKCKLGNEPLFKMVRATFGDDRTKGMKEFLYLSQVQQAMAIKKAIEVFAVNDTRKDVTDRVRVRVFSADGKLLAEKMWDCTARAGSSTKAGVVRKTDGTFLVLDFSGHRNDYFPPPFRDMAIRTPKIVADVRDESGVWKVTLVYDRKDETDASFADFRRTFSIRALRGREAAR